MLKIGYTKKLKNNIRKTWYSAILGAIPCFLFGSFLFLLSMTAHFCSFFMLPVAGLSISSPWSVNREPWQGQSHDRSWLFHFRAQPIWGQRGAVGHRREIIASAAFRASCGCSTLRLGSKSPPYGCPLPVSICVRHRAATIEPVMPHLLKPDATYRLGVALL